MTRITTTDGLQDQEIPATDFSAPEEECKP